MAVADGQIATVLTHIALAQTVNKIVVSRLANPLASVRHHIITANQIAIAHLAYHVCSAHQCIAIQTMADVDA